MLLMKWPLFKVAPVIFCLVYVSKFKDQLIIWALILIAYLK